MAKTFRLTIDTGNAAFSDAYWGAHDTARVNETARILREVADQLEAGEEFDKYQTLFDVYGNDVGRAAFKETP